MLWQIYDTLSSTYTQTIGYPVFENVAEHDNFFQNAFAIEGSVTPKVIVKVILFMTYASFISLLNSIYPSLIVPIGPFEYGGLAMGLILVFRVNAGYDRWWEARKIWGNVVNHCRNLSIILMQYTAPDQDNLWAKKMCTYIMAFPWLMKNHLRDNKSLKPLKEILDDDTYLKLSSSKNRIIFLSNLMAANLNEARVHQRIDLFTFLRAEETRSMLVDSLGGCERILKTPMPFVMAVKSHRFILFFLLVLPFALIHDLNLYIAPMIYGLVAYALFALDRIGVELQNPFSETNLSHLPLNKICDTITRDVYSIMQSN